MTPSLTREYWLNYFISLFWNSNRIWNQVHFGTIWKSLNLTILNHPTTQIVTSLPSYETQIYCETNSQKQKETGQNFEKFIHYGVPHIKPAEHLFNPPPRSHKLFPIPYKHLHNSLSPFGPSVKLNGPQNPSIFPIYRFISEIGIFYLWCWWCNAPPWTWCFVVSLVIDCYKIDTTGIQPTLFYLDF